jgi:hypothetical protein
MTPTFFDIGFVACMVCIGIGFIWWVLFDDATGFLILIVSLGGAIVFGAGGLMIHQQSVMVTYTAANEISIYTGFMDVSKIVRLDVVEHLEAWDERMPIKTIDYPKRGTYYPVCVRPGSVVEVYATDLDGKRTLVASTSSTFGVTVTGNRVSSPKGSIVDVQEYNKNRRPVVMGISWDGKVQYA